jgi:TRAP-type mannitol/chloroaromatic compound transport system permease small subunit
VSKEVSGESAWNPVIWPFRVVWAVGYATLCLQAIAETLRSARVLFGMAQETGFENQEAAQ